MAETKRTTSTEPEEPKANASPAPQAASPDPTFPVTQLVADASDFLGVETYVAAGALYQQVDDLSVADAKLKIEEWLAAPVSQEA